MEIIMKTLFLLLVATLVGCASGTVTEPACDTQLVGSIPASPFHSDVVLPALTYSVPVDFSSDLDKIDTVAKSVQLDVNSLTLNGNVDLSSIRQVTVSLEGETPTTPEAVFASYTANGDPGKTLPMDIVMDSDTLFTYLSGPATMTFSVVVMADTPAVNLTSNVCISITGSFSGSLP
jgi:hypothetical protein